MMLITILTVIFFDDTLKSILNITQLLCMRYPAIVDVDWALSMRRPLFYTLFTKTNRKHDDST